MKRIKDKEAAEHEAIWPPPPIDQREDVGADTARRYLTNLVWLDVILGIGMGLIFHCFVFYIVTNYILYYLIPHGVDFFWNVVAACTITVLASLLVWSRLRTFYRMLANSMLFASVVEGALLTYVFHLGT